jgi:DNA-binding beta-propeller fold protein YncE
MGRYTLILFFLVAFAGCMDEHSMQVSPVDLFGSRGVFVVNEGNYLYGNSSLSYYNVDTKEVINHIFMLANGFPLGDVALSMKVHKDRGYIVVNNSGCIHVVDINTMLHIATIEGLPSPRHFLAIDDETALVSDLYGRAVSVVNLKSASVSGAIPTGSNSLPFYQHSTENLLRIGNRVFTNCWSFDNKILVISLESFSVIDSVEVGVQPLAMTTDRDGYIWVVNDGGYQGNPFGYEHPSLMRINTSTLSVELRFNFQSVSDNTGQIATNPAGDSLYFICNHLYRMHINDTSLPLHPIVQNNGRNFRALAVDPISGHIYISDAGDYMSEGLVYRYKPNGLAVDTISVGIIPGSFCFN